MQTQVMEYTDVHIMHVVSESVSESHPIQLSEVGVGEGRRSRKRRRSTTRNRTGDLIWKNWRRLRTEGGRKEFV